MPTGPSYRLAKVAGRDHWHIVWSEGGRTRRVSTGQTDQIAAREELDRFLKEIDAAPGGDMPVWKLLDLYVQARPGQAHHAKSLSRHLGQRPVADITAGACRAYTAQRREEGATDGTIRRELVGVLGPAAAWAAREGLYRGPTPGIEAPSGGVAKTRVLTPQEVRDLLTACVDPHLHLFVWLAICTGARTGALLALTWDRVNFDRKIIDLRHEGAGRTKRAAVVPMADALLQPLAMAKARATTPYVIEYAGRRVGSIKKGFAAAVAKAGIAKATPHDLRRTVGSWMAESGVGLRLIGSFLGHSTVAVTEKHYAHLSLDALRAPLEAVERELPKAGRLDTNGS